MPSLVDIIKSCAVVFARFWIMLLRVKGLKNSSTNSELFYSNGMLFGFEIDEAMQWTVSLTFGIELGPGIPDLSLRTRRILIKTFASWWQQGAKWDFIHKRSRSPNRSRWWPTLFNCKSKQLFGFSVFLFFWGGRVLLGIEVSSQPRRASQHSTAELQPGPLVNGVCFCFN